VQPHRVVNRAGVSRYSFPLFFDPNFVTPVEPLPIAASATTGEARWDDIDLHAESEPKAIIASARSARPSPNAPNQSLMAVSVAMSWSS
jgi:isopenicillin N synthase-like dioxygenase